MADIQDSNENSNLDDNSHLYGDKLDLEALKNPTTSLESLRLDKDLKNTVPILEKNVELNTSSSASFTSVETPHADVSHDDPTTTSTATVSLSSKPGEDVLGKQPQQRRRLEEDEEEEELDFEENQVECEDGPQHHSSLQQVHLDEVVEQADKGPLAAEGEKVVVDETMEGGVGGSTAVVHAVGGVTAASESKGGADVSETTGEDNTGSSTIANAKSKGGEVDEEEEEEEKYEDTSDSSSDDDIQITIGDITKKTNYALDQKKLMRKGAYQKPGVPVNGTSSAASGTAVSSATSATASGSAATNPQQQPLDLLRNLTVAMVKIGFPSQSECAQSAYSKLDFDCDDDEFNSFFLKYRMDMSTVVKLITTLDEKLAVQCSLSWLNSILSSPIPDQDICKPRSRAFCEWEACQTMIECVTCRLQNAEVYAVPGCKLLTECISYTTMDPLILSSQLSCLSALFIFTKFSNDILPLLIEKIFGMVVFQGDSVMTKGERTKAVKNVRRHACGVFIKIAKTFPDLLLPAFDQLRRHIENLSNDINELSTLESCTLVEALIIICNKYENFEIQSKFISEIMSPIVTMWNNDIKDNIATVPLFMSFVGLDREPVVPSSADVSGINRSKITCCVNTLRAVLLRSRSPHDIEDAIKGGFCTSDTTDNIQNPATQYCLPMLEHILTYTKTMNELWLPEHLALRHADFSTVYDILENEKRTILGLPTATLDANESDISRSPQHRMSGFIHYSHDICCFIMGSLGDALKSQFYKVTEMPSAICRTILSNMQNIPDYKMRMIVRGFLKPITQSCPLEDVPMFLLPILAYLCPLMLERMLLKWKIVDQQCEGNPYEGDDPECAEILNALLTRQFTREYIEFLANLLYDNKIPVDVMSDTPIQNVPKEISELGICLIQHPDIKGPFVLSIFNGMVIRDTTTASKCLSIGILLVKQLEKNAIELADILHLFRMLLQSIQIHGQHDAMLPSQITLGLFMYEEMRPVCPQLFEMMCEISSCSREQLDEFEKKLPANYPANMCVFPEKRRKEVFKNLISDIIGKNIGQAFSKKAAIDNLPPMYKSSRSKKNATNILDNIESSGLENLFT